MKLRRDEFRIPPGAVTWACWQHYQDNAGKPRRRGMKGEPLPSGEVATSWDVGDLSPTQILEWWGPGRYRVDFFDVKGEFVKGGAATIEVAAPTSHAPKLGKRKKRIRDDDDDAEAPAGKPVMRESMGFTEVWALLQQERRDGEARVERAIETQRLEMQHRLAEQQANHQFMMQIVTQVGAARAPADGMAELLQRELKLSVRELGANLRQEFAQAQPEVEPDDDIDPPANPEEAVDGIITSALGSLEQEVPGIIRDVVLPSIGDWLKSRGKGLTPETAAKVTAAAGVIQGRRHANGS